MTFERKIMKKMYGPTRTEDGYWRIKTNQKINDILKKQNIIGFIKKQRLNWLGHVNPLNPELNPICYFLALLGAHHFLHVSRIRVKLLTIILLMSYIYGAPILDVSRSHTTTQHGR